MIKVNIQKEGFESEFTVPEGCTVSVNGKIVLIEPKFKKGDIITHKNGAIIIYTGKYNYGINPYDDYCEKIVFQMPREWVFSDEKEKAKLYSVLKDNGKVWNPEKLCIEDLKVEPKDGDYVKYRPNTGGKWGYLQIKILEDGRYGIYGQFIGCIDQIVHNETSGKLSIGTITEVIDKDQFQSELNALGFEYDFENDTIGELKWKPKNGEFYYFVDVDFTTNGTQFSPAWSSDSRRISVGNCFKTQEKCDNFAKEKGLR